MSANLGIRIPNVSSIPSSVEPKPGKLDAPFGEFEKALEQATKAPNLEQVRNPLKFSAHAMQRLNDRKIPMDGDLMVKVNEALDKAAAKGLDDTLILTKDAAFIVNVKNRTVVTALDRNSLSGNVFTNIDGAVIL